MELQKYKLNEYNNFLKEKKRLFEEFQNNFKSDTKSNENLKNREIERIRNYYEQQINYPSLAEQQQQNINAFIKQLEINGDPYSEYLLNLLKN